ncbi:MAG: hypothetical protein N2A42_10150 [Luteolibacter sp.]
MRIHFSQLFWGLLLFILDFSINGIDLFADGIGYLIVAILVLLVIILRLIHRVKTELA